MLNEIKKFLVDEEGATAVEYGLIVGVIAVGILVALTAVQGGLTTLFNEVTSALTSAGG